MKIAAQSHNVVDIIHGVIPFNGIEMKVIEDPLFARLQRVYQSSLLYMTFPSNKVHRYEHSLGVMHLSGSFFYHAIRNSDLQSINRMFNEVIDSVSAATDFPYGKNTFCELRDQFANICNQIDRDNEWYTSSLYRDSIPSNIQASRIYYILFEAIRLVGLLHDIGHLPYSHISEHALSDLYREVCKEKKPTENMTVFINVYKQYSKSKQLHEELGQRLVNNIFSTILEETNRSDFEEDFFITTVFKVAWLILTSNSGIFLDIHKIVDGVIDCDRMDFTCRDLFCAGVSNETPRYERIFNTVRIHYEKPPVIWYKEDQVSIENRAERENCYFAFNSKAIGQIEFLMQRRWEDYANLNYHHSVHKHELLLKNVIVELGREYLQGEKVTAVVGNRLPLDISAIWTAMGIASGNANVDILFSQLDDEWLNTLIRQKFFEQFGTTYKDHYIKHNDIKWNIMDELITGRKHYCPLFKRRGGFARFDDEFKQVLTERLKEDVFTPEELQTNPFFVDVMSGRIDSYRDSYKECMKQYSVEEIYRRINAKLHEWAVEPNTKKTFHVIDCILDENSFSVGIKARDCQSVFLISSIEGEKVNSLKNQTLIYSSILNQKRFFPPFHVFYLPNYNKDTLQYDEVDKNRVLHVVAEKCVDILLELSMFDKGMVAVVK